MSRSHGRIKTSLNLYVAYIFWTTDLLATKLAVLIYYVQQSGQILTAELWLTVSLGTQWGAILPRKATNLVWVAFDDVIVVLAWECNHVVSSVALSSIAANSAEQVTCLLSSQEHIRVIGRSNRIIQKGILRSIIQYTKERLFQNNNGQQEQNALDEYVHLLQPPRKLGSCSNLCYRDFANVTLKTREHE